MRRAVSMVALLVLAACAGTAARENVLVPAMRATWPRIAENVNRGVPDARTAGERDRMTVALDAGDIPGILAVDWPALKATASAGIADMQSKGEIGPGVAVSLLQRLESFHESVNALRAGGGQ